MSEKEKKDIPAEEVSTEPAAEELKEEAVPETFTVSREQMEKMEGLAQMLAESSDKYLRLAAEYDNFRKRSAKEREGLYQDVRSDTIVKLLPVYDNLARALAHETADTAYKKGVEMTMTQLEEILNKMNVTPIPAVGEKFDPALHNAVMHVEDETVEDSIIVQEYEKGFKLGDKVIRFSVVVVAN